jgi:hypothetical protein
MIDDSAGIDIATAMFAARINSIDRTWLRVIVRYRMKRVRCPILPHFTFPISTNLVQKGIFPCEELDQFHATQQFLKQLCPLIRPYHRLSTNRE